MIHFIRKTRQALLADNRLGSYLLYAGGEILLVIIGILAALYINGLSDARKEREQELSYLASIRTDLGLNLAEKDRYLGSRQAKIQSAERVLEHFNGKPVTDYAAFNADGQLRPIGKDPQSADCGTRPSTNSWICSRWSPAMRTA